MTAWPRLLILLAALVPLSGCATAALNAALRASYPHPPWDGEVAVASEPPGARCTVNRGDQVMAEVPAAPGKVTLSRSHSVLEVRCRSDGYLETAEVLRPMDDPAVFRMAPNGIIGATATVISLASARTMRYPGEVTITLVPQVFPDEETRTRFFETRRATILALRADRIAMAEERCRAQSETTCDPALLVMQREQEQDLARLARMQEQSRIGPVDTVAQGATPAPIAAAAAVQALSPAPAP